MRATPSTFEFLAPPLRHRLFVIINPTAGRGRQAFIARVLGHLRERGAAIEIQDTKARGDAELYARTARQKADDYDLILAVGGDGTLNEVVNGLVTPGSPSLTASPPFAFIPAGTANVLAAELAMPQEPSELAELFLSGATREIRLGAVNGRAFLAMASVGFDSAIVAGLQPSLKRLFGKGAYVLEGLRQWVQPQGWNFRYQVTIDGEAFHNVSWVIATRGQYYAGRFLCAPGASFLRKEMHLCLFRGESRLSVLRMGWALIRNRLPYLSFCQQLQGHDIVISGSETTPIQADGDVVGHLPAHIHLHPVSLRIIIPAGRLDTEAITQTGDTRKQ